MVTMPEEKPQPTQPVPNQLLILERELSGWTQERLDHLVYDACLKLGGEPRERILWGRLIRRWESGKTLWPDELHRKALRSVFGRSAQQLGFSSKEEKQKPAFWNQREFPQLGRSAFIGHEDTLQRLKSALASRDQQMQAPIQVLMGPAGMGKTRLVLHHISLHQDEYHTIIWVPATQGHALQELLKVVVRLGLLPKSLRPEAERPTGSQIQASLKQWLQFHGKTGANTRWLIVFDGVDTENELRDILSFLPQPSQGHVILSTRLMRFPTSSLLHGHHIDSIAVPPLTPKEGADLLIQGVCATASESQLLGAARRAQSEVTLVDRAGAESISTTLGGIPRDLQQIIAYAIQHNVRLSAIARQRPESVRRIARPEQEQGRDRRYPDMDSDLSGEFLKLYLEKLVKTHQLTGLRGFQLDVNKLVPIDEVFISLRFSPAPEAAIIRSADQHIRVSDVEELKAESNSNEWSYEEREKIDSLIFKVEQAHEQMGPASSISLDQLFERLERTTPYHAAVVQGYPGMGKTTLATRIAIYMARALLGQRDTALELAARPYIPIVIEVGEYARKRGENQSHETSAGFLDRYIMESCGADSSSDLHNVLHQALHDGKCLVIFDGLDEASVDDIPADVADAADQEPKRKRVTLREAVQQDIAGYIETNHNNRFIITSRVARFDRSAFPDYPHFLIAPLTIGQIEDFLPRWCRAFLLKLHALSEESSEAQQPWVFERSSHRSEELLSIIRGSAAVMQMAENPLLLTLIAVMHHNDIPIPRRRVELYDQLTQHLLVARNESRQVESVPVLQAVRYLGPLAYDMQARKHSLIRRSEVVASMTASVLANRQLEGIDVNREVTTFIERIRERSGIFVIRASDYFGFFHRTFQEYFAARHILTKIAKNKAGEIPELVRLVRQKEDLWREPFLLAIGLASSTETGDVLATEILESLLASSELDEFEDRLHALLLAAEGMIEAKTFSIDASLRDRVSRLILFSYEQSLRDYKFELCRNIEDVMRRWLRAVSLSFSKPVPLSALQAALCDSDNLALQRSTLMLLVLIAQDLEGAAPAVFDTLIPPLLALAGKPSIGKYRPDPSVSASGDLVVAHLAVTALRYLGKNGPAGVLVREVRRHFDEHPSHLQLLARYSLETSTWLIPAIVPDMTGSDMSGSASSHNFKQYESALASWIQLRNATQANGLSDDLIKKCVEVFQLVLDCAEETNYPDAYHMLQMLRASADPSEAQSQEPWQFIWQRYLLQELTSKRFLEYDEIANLFITLFADRRSQDIIVERILADFNGGDTERTCAQRYLAMLTNDVTEPDELRDVPRYPPYLANLIYRHYIRTLGNMPHVRNLRYQSLVRHVNDLRMLRNLSFTRHQRYMRDRLFTSDMAAAALNRLASDASEAEEELIAIVQGCVWQIFFSHHNPERRKEKIQEFKALISDCLASQPSESAESSLRVMEQELLAAEVRQSSPQGHRPDPQGMTEDQVSQYLEHLANKLAEGRETEDVPLDLILLGEPVMMISARARTSIEVVETFFWPDHLAIARAASTVAKREELQLPESWLTSAIAASAFVFKKEPELQPKPWKDFGAMRVFLASLRYVLVMKIMSGRSTDDDDVRLLIQRLNLSSADEVLSLIAEFVPSEQITHNMVREIQELMPSL